MVSNVPRLLFDTNMLAGFVMMCSAMKSFEKALASLVRTVTDVSSSMLQKS